MTTEAFTIGRVIVGKRCRVCSRQGCRIERLIHLGSIVAGIRSVDRRAVDERS